jgi:ribosome-associated protein
MLELTPTLSLPLTEIDLSAMRAQGPGGQHVNKTESAVLLRFDVGASSLPEDCKARLLARRDRRIGADGCILIKSQEHRSQERNREAALERLRELIVPALTAPKTRRPTRPSASARRRRVDDKTRRGRVKALRTDHSDD